MKAELEELKKQIIGYKAEIKHNEQQLKQILADKKKDLPKDMQKNNQSFSSLKFICSFISIISYPSP